MVLSSHFEHEIWFHFPWCSRHILSLFIACTRDFIESYHYLQWKPGLWFMPFSIVGSASLKRVLQARCTMDSYGMILYTECGMLVIFQSKAFWGFFGAQMSGMKVDPMLHILHVNPAMAVDPSNFWSYVWEKTRTSKSAWSQSFAVNAWVRANLHTHHVGTYISKAKPCCGVLLHISGKEFGRMFSWTFCEYHCRTNPLGGPFAVWS